MGKPSMYRVESADDPCTHCGSGATWDVVYKPDEIALGTTYGTKDDAEEIADDLNRAWNAGYFVAAQERLEQFRQECADRNWPQDCVDYVEKQIETLKELCS